MGFLMMATLVWLLYVLGKQLGMEAVVWTCAFLVVIALGCWLIGRFATLNAPRRTFVLTWAAAVALAVGGFILFIAPTMEAGRVLAEGPAVTVEEGGVRWEPFTVAKLDAALKETRPVFVDFTAEWCLTCKVNERTVLADREVADAFTRNNVLAFKADWTNRNPDITKLLAKFGRSGVPLYVVFPSGRPDAPIVLPEVITAGIVIDALNRAAASPGAAR
jgi:thiol:disulfide interchange protein DsbD